MSFNNRDEHCKDLDLHEKSLGDEDGKEDNVGPRKFTSVEEIQPLIQLISSRSLSAWVIKKTCEAPIKGLENSTYVPLSLGGNECATCMKGHALAGDSANGRPKD
jgi:hypothetical protein